MEPPHDVDRTSTITFRSPTPADGRELWRIARDSGTLDVNSPYAYVLLGEHHADTSVVAEDGATRVVGFASAYLPPAEPDVVFVWQVAVDPVWRGHGIGRALLHQVIERATSHGARGLTATVTPSNEASRRLFRSVARDLRTRYQEQPLFGAELFPGEGHEAEHRLDVGPL